MHHSMVLKNSLCMELHVPLSTIWYRMESSAYLHVLMFARLGTVSSKLLNVKQGGWYNLPPWYA
jgi:hypothetical protein